jgi:hypothetical protein
MKACTHSKKPCKEIARRTCSTEKRFRGLLRRLKQASIVDVALPGPTFQGEDNPDMSNESCEQSFGPLTK